MIFQVSLPLVAQIMLALNESLLPAEPGLSACSAWRAQHRASKTQMPFLLPHFNDFPFLFICFLTYCVRNLDHLYPVHSFFSVLNLRLKIFFQRQI